MFINRRLANEDLFSCGVKEGLALCNHFCNYSACHLASKCISCFQRMVVCGDRCRVTVKVMSVQQSYEPYTPRHECLTLAMCSGLTFGSYTGEL